MNRQAIETLLKEKQEPPYRLKQISAAVYRQHISSWDEVTTLSKTLRDALEGVPILTLVPSHTVISKRDGTIKTLFTLADEKKIEAVMIPNGFFRTVCVSSQVGCAMKCSFCATGTMGLSRNLTADEIVDQVLFYEQMLGQKMNA